MTTVLGMDDVGKRIEHLMQLQESWSAALAFLTTSGWHSSLEKKRAGELEIALALLQHHMEAEYHETSYAVEINKLPKNAKEII